MPPPPLSVIVVNTGRRELLRRALAALRQADLPAGSELVVVDNASADGSAEMVETEFPEVALVRGYTRRGPAANYNSGFAVSEGEYLVVLNEDAQVTPDALSRLRDFMERNPSVGLAGPRLIYPDGAPQASCQRFPGVSSVFKRLLFQGFLRGAWVRNGYHEEDEGRPFLPDWIMATSLIIRAAALREVGPYDEQFELYYEEVDLAKRLRAAGWRTAWVPDAVVRHDHGVSNFKLRDAGDIHFRLLLYQSRYRYFRKHHGAAYALLIRGLEALFFGLFACKTAVEGLLPSRAEAARLKTRLYAGLLRYALSGRPDYAIPQPE